MQALCNEGVNKIVEQYSQEKLTENFIFAIDLATIVIAAEDIKPM